MTKRTAWFLVILALFHGIASYAEKESVEKQLKRGPFSFTLPQKWHVTFLGQPKRKRGVVNVIITKDGVALNRIELKSRSITAPFDNTRKKIEPGMRPFEIAAIVLDDLQLNTSMKNFSIQENKPATVCGRPGFRAVFSYNDNDALSYKAICYGFQEGKNFYTIRYEAPAIHYFDTYLAAFERIARRVTVNSQDGKTEDGVVE